MLHDFWARSRNLLFSLVVPFFSYFVLPSNRAKLAVPLSLSPSLCWLWLDSFSYWTYMRVGSVSLLPSSLKWLFNCCGKLALLQLAFEKFISESENKTINNFHLWRQFGCSLRFNCTVFLFFFPPLQLKACARVWKQGWSMWPCGWGPVPTIPEETRLLGGIQYPELSSRNCPNKKGTSPSSVTVCYLALSNDQVWFAEGSQHHWW